jgi:hypothetical protein
LIYTPWLCAGDFNEVLNASEHIGGDGRDEEWKMEGFRDAVDYCRFTDMGFSGHPYIILSYKRERFHRESFQSVRSYTEAS